MIKLDEKQKKAILGVAIALCLLVAGSKIYKVYKSFQPPFEAGECFNVENPQLGTVNFKVVENDKANKTTDAVGTINEPFGMPGVRLSIPVRVGFDDLRNDPSVSAAKCEN